MNLMITMSRDGIFSPFKICWITFFRASVLTLRSPFSDGKKANADCEINEFKKMMEEKTKLKKSTNFNKAPAKKNTTN